MYNTIFIRKKNDMLVFKTTRQFMILATPKFHRIIKLNKTELLFLLIYIYIYIFFLERIRDMKVHASKQFVFS